MFWTGNADYDTGTCEYKRTVNQYCYPYDSSWCDFSGPIGQGLICASYVNPYGSEYGKLLQEKKIIDYIKLFYLFRCLPMSNTSIL
jgi:hypothetical protein